MKKIVIASACRTAIGKLGGALKDIPVERLGAVVIREAIARAGIPADAVDEVLMGCVLTGAKGQNVARQAAVLAGVPYGVPATTIGAVCGSGLRAVNLAASMIAAGDAQIVLAGGMENMSGAAYALDGARYGYRLGDGALIDMLRRDALTDAFTGDAMGIIAERIADRFHISRRAQDEYAAESQQKCQTACAVGAFAEEIVPVEITVQHGRVRFDQDEYPRAGVTAESISGLKPAFMEGGTVTAANASGINDGAAAVVVMSEEKARILGVRPLAEFASGATDGVDPAYMGLGPIGATQKALKKAGMAISDLHWVESNEAFAAQAIAVARELRFNPQRVNPLGGAIALGHPVGASGCRILVTLLHQLKRTEADTGLATLCVGGGMGVASIVRRCAW